MQRRDFLLLTAAVTVALPRVALAVSGDPEYSPDLLKAELAAGKTVFLDFNATWCPTCHAQGRAIQVARAADPAYDKAISFVNVDWDIWGNGDLVKELNVPRRSTLLVLQGNKELGRIVADTSKANIKALMDLALQSGA
jgi:thiol:disulfide interchange protein